MIDRGFFVVVDQVIDDTKVHVSQELSCNVCDFLVLQVVLDRVLVVSWFGFCDFLVIDSDTVVSQGFSVNVANSLANLKEPLVLLDSLLELAQVIKQHTGRIVGSTLISRFACSLARESKDVVVLDALLRGNTVIGVVI